MFLPDPYYNHVLFTALCLEGPVFSDIEDDDIGQTVRTNQHASAVLPTALILVAALALCVFILVKAHAKKRLCWRQSYERLRGSAVPDTRPMPHGVPEPEDSGDDADVVYTSRDGSVYRRYGFTHDPEPEYEDINDEEEINENTHLKGTQ